MASPTEPMPPTGTPEWDVWAAQDKGPSILAICWLFNALATIFVIGRIYVRMGMQKHLLADDYWCLIGLLCGYMSVSFTVVAVRYGNGKHYDLLSDTEKEKVLLWTTCAFCPGVLCFGLPKMAVVSLLTRLLNPSKYHKWFLWGLAIWCQLTLFATIGTLLGRCTPAESIWNFDIKGVCVDPKHIVNFSLYAGAYSAFVDVYLAVYPAHALWNLQIKLKKKIALICALGIGTASAAVAIYKTTRIPRGLASPDFSYDSSDLVIWTVVEGSTMIIACSIPVLSPLLDAILKGNNPFRSSRNTGSYYRDQKNHRDMELGSMPNSRRQKPVEHPELETTVFAAWDSQEELRKPSHEISSQQTTHQHSRGGDTSSLEDVGMAGISPVVTPQGHQIMRTNEITVTYDARSVQEPTSSERWRPA